jgi:hypothetical protein
MGIYRKTFWGSTFYFRVDGTNFQASLTPENNWKDITGLSTYLPILAKLTNDPTDLTNIALAELYIDHCGEVDLKKAFPNVYKKYSITLLE